MRKFGTNLDSVTLLGHFLDTVLLHNCALGYKVFVITLRHFLDAPSVQAFPTLVHFAFSRLVHYLYIWSAQAWETLGNYHVYCCVLFHRQDVNFFEICAAFAAVQIVHFESSEKHEPSLTLRGALNKRLPRLI